MPPITLDRDTLRVETSTLTATFVRGFLTELVDRSTGERLIDHPAPEGAALQLHYPGAPVVDVIGPLAAEVAVLRLSDTAAQFRFSGWEADGVLTVSVDEASGDLLLEPSAYSSRPGVLACRWRMPGVADGLDLVAPFFQGVKLPLSDPLLQRRWTWPQHWEAGLAILQGREGGFWVHCRDDRYRYKALQIADGELAFDTEAYGPVDTSLGAGGLVWRVNVHRGDWQVPAGAYRDWLWQAYSLKDAEARRLPWMDGIRFAVSWYRGDAELLDAMAEKLDPRTVLLHYSAWRTDPYDENYPTYEPSDDARAVFAKAKAMGFHVMPHCNAVDMDPTHPVYPYVRDFQYRDVATRRLHGWGYDVDAKRVLGVPNSYHALEHNQRRKVMIKVHPGLAMWRSLLSEAIAGAVDTLGVDTVFTDVTLCSGNLHNALVENTTSSEGMNRLLHEIGALRGGLAVGGEGLNEITMQALSFAQAHLFNSHHATADGLERAGGCALNDFLFGRLCKTFGYSRLGGGTEEERLRMRIHEEHGAIPTVTVTSADEIRNPNEGVARELERARG